VSGHQFLTVLGALFGLLLFVAGAALIVAGIVMTATDRAGRPRCPTCGYPAQGLRGSVCPECGNPLPRTRSALRNAALKLRLDRADRALLWGVGAIIAGVLAVAASF